MAKRVYKKPGEVIRKILVIKMVNEAAAIKDCEYLVRHTCGCERIVKHSYLNTPGGNGTGKCRRHSGKRAARAEGLWRLPISEAGEALQWAVRQGVVDKYLPAASGAIGSWQPK